MTQLAKLKNYDASPNVKLMITSMEETRLNPMMIHMVASVPEKEIIEVLAVKYFNNFIL